MNLKINHRVGVVDIKLFNDVKIDLKYDAVGSTFALKFYFDPFDKQLAEAACVSHFHECILEHNGEVLITGYILSSVLSSGAVVQLAQLGGYSKAGVLEDCEIPVELYPLQIDGLSIREMATKIIGYEKFGLAFYVDDSISALMDEPISVTTIDVVQKIKGFFTEICRQRNIVISHTPDGNVWFTRARTDLAPLFHVEDGLIGFSVGMSFSGQQIHSQITVLMDVDDEGGNSGEATVFNPYCPIVFRPKVMKLTSGNDITVEEAAKNALAGELKNIVLTVVVDRWDINNKIIRPNNVITVKSPKNYLYHTTRFFIESVSFSGSPEAQIATLTCVPPEVYNGESPNNFFVNSHENFPRT
jgi:prophage tail gpP-like protein